MTGQTGDPTGPSKSENAGKTEGPVKDDQKTARSGQSDRLPAKAGECAVPDAEAASVQLAQFWLIGMRLREAIFEKDLFFDPSWEILLDLHSADARNEKLKITNLSAMAHLPPSTTGRWARVLASRGLIVREKDPEDRRRIFVCLSDEGRTLMQTYFRALFEKTQATVQFRQ